LKNVNVGLVRTFTAGSTTDGQLVFNANGTITGSSIVNISVPLLLGVTFAGTNDVLTRSTLTTPAGTGHLLLVPPPTGGSNNLISGNAFVDVGGMTELSCQSGAGAITDRVLNNTFIGARFTQGGISVGTAVSGLTIQGNTLSGLDPAPPFNGIQLFGF